ncbi:MAG: sodium:solute symporter family protein [Trueperaceae bacterium]|nr:sodium:solute symporter family protein [Trueperaceae bacterium]
MSTQLILTFIMVILTFSLYIGIAIWSRVSTTSGFYVAGQGIPSAFNGMATAADWMSAASFISMAGLIAFLGFDGAIYLLGWTGGYVLLALLLAPYLRKFGKFTVPAFIGDRYYSSTARVVAAVCAVVVSFTYVAGQMRGAGIVFGRFLEIPVEWGVIIGMVVVSSYAVLGGMKGITYTQIAQYTVLIIAFIVPAVAIGLNLTDNPLPQGAFMNIAAQLDGIQADLGFSEYTSPFTNISALNVFLITMALMCGTAGLPHVIIRFYTTKTVRGARWTGVFALFFIGLLYTTAPAVGAFAKYNLIETVSQKPYDSLPSWFSTWEDTGLLQFNDKNGDGLVDYRPGAFDDPESSNELFVDRDIMVLANPEIAGLPPLIIAFVVAGGLAAALSTASGLLLVIASSFSHDIYKTFINKDASEANELLVARIAMVGAVILAGLLGIFPPGFVSEVVAFAFGLAAASFFPAIVLGIFDKRTNNYGAISGMLTGIIFTAFYIITAVPRFGIGWGNWIFDISPQGIGTIGMLISFAVTYTVSRMTAEPPAEIQALVENVRYPRGAGAAQAHD